MQILNELRVEKAFKISFMLLPSQTKSPFFTIQNHGRKPLKMMPYLKN